LAGFAVLCLVTGGGCIHLLGQPISVLNKGGKAHMMNRKMHASLHFNGRNGKVRMLFWTVLATVVGIAFAQYGSIAQAQDAGKRDKPVINYRNPPREYQDFKTGNWVIKLEKQMLVEDPALAQRASARLEQKLALLLTILPKHTHAELQQVPIYLMFGPRATGGGEDSGLSYFQKNAPDFNLQLDPQWRHCVVIKSAPNYLALSEFWSIKPVVHEMGHAWHLMHWPEKQPDILAPWQNATERGFYQNVTDVNNGQMISRAYALTNQLEYFAELTCMYFVGCNYPPLNRRELQLYDPNGYAMIETKWGVVNGVGQNDTAAKKATPSSTRGKSRSQKPIVTSDSAAPSGNPVPKEYRTWIDTLDNSQIEAQFAGALGGNIRLRKKDGSVITIPKEQLSKEDQDWLGDHRR
jgi:hypothetical protein